MTFQPLHGLPAAPRPRSAPCPDAIAGNGCRASRRGRLLAVSALLAALLAGCGGGGDARPAPPPPPGGGTGAPTPAPTPAPVPAPAPTPTPAPAPSLVLEVPQPDYAAGSIERAAFDLLNAERGRCGFGLVAQNRALDAAARDHFSYLRLNRGAYGHEQLPGAAGFTARTPQERAALRGYDGFAGENVGWQGKYPDGRQRSAIRQLLAAPYHTLGLLYGVREMGFASAWVQSAGEEQPMVVLIGTPRGQSGQVRGGVVTYPCEGTTGVAPTGQREAPSPFPSEFNPVWGHPIIVMGEDMLPGSRDLFVTQVAITGPGGSVAIKALYGAGNQTDPNGFCKGPYTCIIPQPLQPNTRYQVTLAGLHRGVTFSRSFGFSTGPEGGQ